MLRYDVLYALAGSLASPILGLYLLKTGEWRTDWSGRFGHIEAVSPDERKTGLVHGVSVGEVAAARTLVKLLDEESLTPVRTVISSTTNTGIARAGSLFGSRHAVVRFPLDFSWMVRRFLDAIQPAVVVLTELELWPNLLAECERRQIRVCVVNGRLTETSERHYRLLSTLFRPMFNRLSAVGVQTEEYARRFVTLGVPEDRIHIKDTMK
jgi:3-deoxy-D-manno-octulosonic-acid transferase